MNGALVWISTYTASAEPDRLASRLFPTRAAPQPRRAAQGRVNYLCLLNLDDLTAAGPPPYLAIPLGLVARWALATRDGDLMGGDFPGWIAELFGPAAVYPLADRRGECIHSACPHYKACFVEHSIRRARGAGIVIANHALVMVQAALGGGEDGLPLRLVFDEGHHLFDAADPLFRPTCPASRRRSFGVGCLAPRAPLPAAASPPLEELIGERQDLAAQLDAALHAARTLPVPGWPYRLAGPPRRRRPTPERRETFLHAARDQVRARTREAGDSGLYDSECDLFPLTGALPEAAETLDRALRRLMDPLSRCATASPPAGGGSRGAGGRRAHPLEAAAARSTPGADARRAWLGMSPPCRPTHRCRRRPAYVTGSAGTPRRRDPMPACIATISTPPKPFAAAVAAPAHGVLITSATLRDEAESDQDDPETVCARPRPAPAPPTCRPGHPRRRPSLRLCREHPLPRRHRVAKDIPARSPPSLPGAVPRRGGGGSACSPPSAGCARSMPASPAHSNRPAYRSTPACGCDGQRHPGRCLPRRGTCLPARHRCDAGRGGRARLLPAPAGIRPRAWPRPTILHRESRLHSPAAGPRTTTTAPPATAAPGLRPADPPRRRQGRVRHGWTAPALPACCTACLRG